MKCPVCDENMESMVCTCGYDASRDYEKYPTFGMLPVSVESVACLRDRRNNLLRCAGCGYHGFALNKTEGRLACMRCGRALTEEELKPLTDRLGMKKAEQKKKVTQKEILEAVLDPENVAKYAKPLEEITEAELEETFELLAEPMAEDPNRIVAIAAGYDHTVALYADGTVKAVGDNSEKQCDLSGWKDITAISAGYHHTTGLKKDGTVVMAGLSFNHREDALQWRDIVAISDGIWHTVGLKRDGTVVAAGQTSKGRCDVSGWKNIKAISAGDTFTMGLDRAGNVLTAGKGKGAKLPYGGWNNTKAIAAGFSHSVSLTKEGMTRIQGNGGKAEVLGATIVDIDAGFDFTVVRKKNGTAAATGVSFDGRCDVQGWKDLVSISAGRAHTVGLKKDGTLVATGDNSKGQCDVHKLMRK